MQVDLGPLLTPHFVGSASAEGLLSYVKDWLEQENLVWLMHPHGFYVVRLADDETEDWRFHFWPPGPRKVTGMPAFIHTHDRHVESRILQGEMENTVFEVTTGTVGHPLYEVTYGGDRYLPGTSNYLKRTTEMVQPIAREVNVMKKGDWYRIERHAYHAAAVSERSSAATLVRMHGRAPGPVRVVGLEGYPDTIAFTRTEYRADVFVGQLGP